MRRSPILVAFLHQALLHHTDVVVERYDRCLWAYHGAAQQELKEWRAAADETAGLIRPRHDDAIDFFGTRYPTIGQFASTFLRTLTFHAQGPDDTVLRAVEVIRALDLEPTRRPVLRDVPMALVTEAWRPYIREPDDRISRRYYELCTLWRLRSALRAGNIWIEIDTWTHFSRHLVHAAEMEGSGPPGPPRSSLPSSISWATAPPPGCGTSTTAACLRRLPSTCTATPASNLMSPAGSNGSAFSPGGMSSYGSRAP